MCDVCGCGDPEIVSIDVHDRILTTNDRVAHHNREHFRRRGCVAINLMGSPGSGKTARGAITCANNEVGQAVVIDVAGST